MMHDAVALDLGSDVLDGLRMSLDDGQNRGATAGQPQALHRHASHLNNEDAVRGALAVRLPGQRYKYQRFCIFSPGAGTLKVCRSADDALRSRVEATTYVCFARARGGTEFALRTHEGEIVVCSAASAAEASRWLPALSAAHTKTQSGYVFVDRKKGPWKRRWAVFCTSSGVLCLYQDKGKEANFAIQAFDAKSRGHLRVEHAIKKSLPKLPFAFAVYGPDGQMLRMSADGPESLEKWLDAIPRLATSDIGLEGAAPRPSPAVAMDVSAVPPPPPPPPSGADALVALHLGAPGVGMAPVPTPTMPVPIPAMQRAKSSKTALLAAMRKELLELRAKELRAKEEQERESLAELSSRTDDEGRISRGQISRLSKAVRSMSEIVAGGAEDELEAHGADRPALADDEGGESDAEDEEEDWDGDGASDVPQPATLGLSADQLSAHSRPLLSKSGRDNMREQVDVSRELEELKAQLEAARQENLKLKLATGGATSESDEKLHLDAYLGLLREVVAMRRANQFDADLFERYNGAMVELSEEHVREMYQSFMLIYVGEADHVRAPCTPLRSRHVNLACASCPHRWQSGLVHGCTHAWQPASCTHS